LLSFFEFDVILPSLIQRCRHATPSSARDAVAAAAAMPLAAAA